MPVQKISIEEFLSLAKQYPVLDVRSPGEYTHAHIPTAHSLPLFTDEERKQVGTAYKQQSREAAIKIGLDYFGLKMRKMVEEIEGIVRSQESGVKNLQASDSELLTPNSVLVHCWRGGMRSAAVAWLLDLYGFKVYLLVGGYKAYRKWILEQFEKDYNFNIIGGYTGSGKTLLVHELIKENKTVIDLEGLANHKGSAFGAIENMPQPGQEMFENLLAQALADTGYPILDESTQNQASSIQYPASAIYIEDESQRIGNLQIPMPLWHTMRKAPVFFLDIPFEERLNYITEEYGKLKKETLKEAILRIQKRLGGLETKNAINFLEEKQYAACFRILLTYYDKWYHKGLYNRENISSLLNKIPCTGVDTQINTQKLLSCNIVSAL
ncbi:MAG: tRNA 2-selenouridine(34) synthase MnmH [Chitinophagaceae bacterium]|nr:tRNA 2-selenouridine(34) synthase MnmH [Chitinophagaceae bacterium]MBK8785416.1 tRNA 2-selenouridine(34) synthase MnmH [Chitinophagaceae bacterium]MBK9484604.1 tRNA 2-selenouridine(34) synthase MnmH [Chitinophagaceae bacterium]MBL0199193.1 tRNA 2-selenouridine(34) synthase MnmH [Chitinophagaceae bacterium]